MSVSVGMLESFDYELPAERIAPWPDEVRTGDRATSRLLVAQDRVIVDATFNDLPTFLKAGDLLVFNDSRVNKRRIFAQLEGDTGERSREVELFVFRESADGVCEALARPARRLKPGSILRFQNNATAEVLGRGNGGESVRFCVRNSAIEGDKVKIGKILDGAGVMPIPPYIRGGRGEVDDERYYQNVYAKNSGSVAAPTAGLHFSDELISKLRVHGVAIGFVTLHVGLWSIVPNRESTQERAVVGTEEFIFPASVHQQIVTARSCGGRVIPVGTTSCRVLETVYAELEANDKPESVASVVESQANRLQTASLAISPGYRFRIVDALVTNFHQPRSTHLSVVSALMGVETMRRVYNHALAGDYKFLSYGDGMLLSPGES